MIKKVRLHNANVIVDQMMARLQIDEDKRTATVTQHATRLAYVNQANATMEYQMKTLLCQVQNLQLAKTHKKQTNNGSNFGCGRGRGRGNGASRGTGRGQSSTPSNPKYCWTHGNFAHRSEKYTYPSNGHKKDATFAHMMGGNTRR